MKKNILILLIGFWLTDIGFAFDEPILTQSNIYTNNWCYDHITNGIVYIDGYNCIDRLERNCKIQFPIDKNGVYKIYNIYYTNSWNEYHIDFVKGNTYSQPLCCTNNWQWHDDRGGSRHPMNKPYIYWYSPKNNSMDMMYLSKNPLATSIWDYSKSTIYTNVSYHAGVWVTNYNYGNGYGIKNTNIWNGIITNNWYNTIMYVSIFNNTNQIYLYFRDIISRYTTNDNVGMVLYTNIPANPGDPIIWGVVTNKSIELRCDTINQNLIVPPILNIAFKIRYGGDVGYQMICDISYVPLYNSTISYALLYSRDMLNWYDAQNFINVTPWYYPKITTIRFTMYSGLFNNNYRSPTLRDIPQLYFKLGYKIK